MNFRKLILYIFLIIGFTACKKARTNSAKEIKRMENIQKVYNTCDSLEDISNKKTSTLSVNDYGRKMEHAMCEKAKLLRGLSTEDKLLVEYDAAKKILENIAHKGEHDPELYKNQEFTKKANEKMNKVREFYNQLIKANLDSYQKRRFDEITKRKI